MEEVLAEMRRFFERYEGHANADDPGGIVSQFAESFMTADASGCRVVSATELAAGIVKRKQIFDRVGSRSTSLVSLETRELGERYVLAETEWLVRFERKEAGEISLRSSFVVYRSQDGPKIVFYLMHQNPLELARTKDKTSNSPT